MLIATVEDLKTLAERVLVEMRERGAAELGASVLALHGELGAGKTTFTQALAQTLGVNGNVTSPTFVVMRLYPIKAHDFFKTLVHIDAYRIESLDEVAVIGVADLLRDRDNLICIEWAERIEEALPKDALHITLTQGDVSKGDAERKAVYGYGT